MSLNGFRSESDMLTKKQNDLVTRALDLGDLSSILGFATDSL